MRTLTHRSGTLEPPDEAEYTLIHRAAAGDEEAFEVLYRIHRPRVHATVARFLRNGDEVADLVQLTFMKAFQGLVGFRGQSAFSTWLTRIALNLCTTHLRTRRAQRNCLDEVARSITGSLNWWAPAPYENPEAAAAQKECRDLVRQGIRALPAKHREAIWLHYVKERSYHEITEELRVPLGTVKVWLYRGRNQLRDAFERMGIGA